MIQGLTLGDPVCATVTGSSPDYTITSIVWSKFLYAGGPSDQAGSVARGIFSPGCVPFGPGESPYWDWEPD
jgi:hypothetical protein